MKEVKKHLISRDEFGNYCSAAMASVSSYLVEDKRSSWTPMLDCLCRDVGSGALGSVTVIVPFTEETGGTAALRHKTLFELGQVQAKQLRDLNMVCIGTLLFTEAWISAAAGRNAGLPSEQGDRREVITLAAATLDPATEGMATAVSLLPLSRDADNHLVPGEWESPKDAQVRPHLLLAWWQGWQAGIAAIRRADVEKN